MIKHEIENIFYADTCYSHCWVIQHLDFTFQAWTIFFSTIMHKHNYSCLVMKIPYKILQSVNVRCGEKMISTKS